MDTAEAQRRHVVDQKSPLQARKNDVRGTLRVELERQQKAPAPDLVTARRGARPALSDPSIRYPPINREFATSPSYSMVSITARRRRARHRSAAHGGGVVARLERLRKLAPGDAGADRQAVAQRFGQGDHVRLRAGVLEAEHLAGPAEPGLDLVEDQRQVVLSHRLRAKGR